MLVLYYAPGASSFAPHIALNEAGVAFKLSRLDFSKGENRSPEYLAINPEGKVPTLLIDGRILVEVAGILFYIAKSFPDSKLLPEDAEAQAQVVSWMSFIASTLHPSRRISDDYAREVYRIGDAKLGAKNWVLGNTYSIADIHLFRLFWRFQPVLGLTKQDCPNLYAHRLRMIARPAVKQTIEIEERAGYNWVQPPIQD